MGASRRPGTLGASFEVYRATFRDVEGNRAHTGKLPMSVLAVGDGGGVSVGEAPPRSLEAVTGDATGVLIPGCGHWVAEEKPEEFSPGSCWTSSGRRPREKPIGPGVRPDPAGE